MIDQSQVNLFNLIPGAFKKVGSTGGGEHHGPCPFCGGTDRFIVQPHAGNGGRWWCRQCGKSGDALAFLMEFKGLDFKAACAELRLTVPEGHTPRPQGPRPDLSVGDLKEYACFEPAWQTAAEDFVYATYERLQKSWNGTAGRYLEGRGIGKACAFTAWLGLNPEPYQATWGSVEVYLPRGITIPWVIDTATWWNIRVRRPNADLAGTDLAKYASTKGCANGLYHAHYIQPGKTVIMTEGEFDALVLENALRVLGRDDVAVVSIGSNTGAHVLRWVARLALAKDVLLAFDGDAAGDAAAVWWLDKLPGLARRVAPTQKDITEMWQAGVLGEWIGKVA